MSSIREETFKHFPKFHHTFKERRREFEYALIGSTGLTPDDVKAFQAQTEKMYSIVEKAEAMILSLSDQELLNLGFHEKMLPYLRINCGQKGSVTSRFDAIRTRKGLKFIELNSDTPGLIMENFFMDEALSTKFGRFPIMEKRRDLLRHAMYEAVKNGAEYLGKHYKDCNVVVVSHSAEQDLEEFNTVRFYQEVLARAGVVARFLNYDDLIVSKEGAFTRNGIKIDILFKLAYPYQLLVDNPVAMELLDLTEHKELALLNPPTSYVKENKSLFSFIWDNLNSFDSDEQQFIKEHVPLTSIGKHDLTAEYYVVKPAFGRQGAGILMDKSGIELKSKEDLYQNELKIYQDYVRATTQHVEAMDRTRTLREVLGLFIIDGKFAGLVCSLGDQIMEDKCHWIGTHLDLD